MKAFWRIFTKLSLAAGLTGHSDAFFFFCNTKYPVTFNSSWPTAIALVQKQFGVSEHFTSSLTDITLKYNAAFTTTETNKSQSLGIKATSCNRKNFQKGRRVSWTGSNTVERALAEWGNVNGKYGSSGLKGRQRWNPFNASYCFLFGKFWLGKPELFANTCCSLHRKKY